MANALIELGAVLIAFLCWLAGFLAGKAYAARRAAHPGATP